MDTTTFLKEACFNGEVLKIKYRGGSQPGAAREIYPLSISDEKVHAKCLTSNSEKAFFIDKIKMC
jgi:hypothetical protein